VVWQAFHWLNVFSNRDYGAIVILDDDGTVVHRSMLFPRYFRFPFMSAGDLQIGSTWTAPSHRGRGLATVAMEEAVRIESRPSRRFWYVIDRDNVASARVAEKAGFTLAGNGVRTRKLGARLLGAYELAPRS